jgi:uncharacterized protein
MSKSPTAYLPPGLPTPAPTRDGLDAPFWEATRRHRLVVQRCPACGTHQFGPEWLCHECLRFDPEWVEVEPAGTIFSWTRVHHPTHPALRDAVPYLAVVVELAGAGGVRLVGNLLGDPLQPVSSGLPVTGVFEDHDDADPPFTLVQWRLAGPVD